LLLWTVGHASHWHTIATPDLPAYPATARQVPARWAALWTTLAAVINELGRADRAGSSSARTAASGATFLSLPEVGLVQGWASLGPVASVRAAPGTLLAPATLKV